MPTIDAIRAALADVQDPAYHRDIVSLNTVTRVFLDGTVAHITLEILPTHPEKDQLRRLVETAALSVPGVTGVQVEMRPRPAEPKPAAAKTPLPGVTHIVAVYACKGGVGKSTVSTNLAVALAARGLSVGLLDADVHGPNIPLMMGATGRASVSEENRIAPVICHGVRVMSLALVMGETAPKIWRGPMVHGAVQQLLRDTDWGPTDILIVDLPPGTGDAQITVAQAVPLAGIVFVSTPQAVSLLDGAKGIGMFERLGVRPLGLVENMSGFRCPHCDTVTNVFSSGGGRAEAEKRGIPFLGAIPLDPAIVSGGDTGRPLAATEPKGAVGQLFAAMAERITGLLAAVPGPDL